MTTPCSPASISMSQVNTELSISPSTTIISLDQANVRTLAGVTTPGTTISMSDLRCKTDSGSTLPKLTNNVIEVWDSTGGLDTNGWFSQNDIKTKNDATLAGANIDNPNSGNKKQTTYLVGNTLNLGVPAGKTLSNLEFKFRIRANHTGDPTGPVQVYRVSLFNNTTKIGVVQTPAIEITTPTLIDHTVSGNSAFWGVTLTSALVNSSLFGAGLVVRNYSGKGNYTVQYAWMEVTASW